jgi:dihydrofolate reductase
MSPADKEFMDSLSDGLGAGICGRGMYEAAGRWGGTNPFEGTLVVLTHRTEDAPDPSTGFVFVDGFDAALARAREAAGDRGIAVSGGADTIRQALRAGVVDVLAISTAPVILGAGKRLFDGFAEDVDLEIDRVHTSQWATHVVYRVRG